MLNLLFLLASAYAADIYEVCVLKNQKFNETTQEFETFAVDSFYSKNTKQLIVFDTYFEVDREKYPIIEKTTKDGLQCWRQHKNSELCYSKVDNVIYWEANLRNGETHRSWMKVCVLNGEPTAW